MLKQFYPINMDMRETNSVPHLQLFSPCAWLSYSLLQLHNCDEEGSISLEGVKACVWGVSLKFSWREVLAVDEKMKLKNISTAQKYINIVWIIFKTICILYVYFPHYGINAWIW